MREHVEYKGRGKHPRLARHYPDVPIGVAYGKGGQSAEVQFKGGKKGLGTCLGCSDTPCMVKQQSDPALPGSLNAFPGDPSVEVCPAAALIWDNENRTVSVRPDACIGCGLCVLQCPYGAITLDKDGYANVCETDPTNLTSDVANEEALIHPEPARTGRLGSSDSAAMKELPSALDSLSDVVSNKLVRDVFLAVGVACRVRRKGDTNVRMDGLAAFADGKLGVLEIEFSAGVLESPRSLLEDVAVLHSRYGVSISSIHPISIVLTLPNVRSEYYQVIDDIEKVLGLRCRTISLGALLVMLRNLATLNSLADDAFRTHQGGSDLSPSVLKYLKGSGLEGEPYPACFKPFK